ncbi:MAG: DUF937 domain-containing protein [Bacteroidetes bacterium]|nr:DUF937 domain-containing protein [Bacteroidota bacterium]MCB0843160.1 DUF937 domain-containing protein [Bacteroidota bacterium]
MSLIEQLTQQISGQALQSLSQQIGADPNTTNAAISAALPMLVGAMAKNASTQDGAASLHNALANDHDGSILDNLGSFLGSPDNGPGAGILRHVLGAKQTGVEQGVSQLSGMDASKVTMLLQNLAPLIMGYLGQQQRKQGLDIGGLASILFQEKSRAAQGSGTGSSALDMLGGLLDQDGDGSFLDDIGGMLGGFLKR